MRNDASTAAAINEICRRLNGLPLAVELAASRTTALTPAEILVRLDDAFSLLRLPEDDGAPILRHRSLQASIQFSVDLLDSAEAELLDRLSVFRGTFGIDAVEAICGAGEERPTLDTIERLVERSLVVALDSPVGKRYRLLDLIRDFVSSRLRAKGTEWTALHERHAATYRSFVEAADRGSRGSDSTRWQHAVEAEVDNLRAAFDRYVETSRVDDAQALVADLWSPLYQHGGSFLSHDWAPTALALSATHVGRATAAARAVATWGAQDRGELDLASALAESAMEAIAEGSHDDGSVANVVAVQSTFTLTGFDRARAVADAEVQLAERRRDGERLVRALLYRCFTYPRGDTARRVVDSRRAIVEARSLGHAGLLAFAHSQLAWPLHSLGDAEAGHVALEARRLAREANFPLVEAYACHLLGTIARERGRPTTALSYFAGALHIWRWMGDARAWHAVHQIAEVLADVGRLESALTLCAAVGDRNLGVEVHLDRRARADIRGRLDGESSHAVRSARAGSRQGCRGCTCTERGPTTLELPALVAQGIEHRPPEPGAQVRILPGALLRCRETSCAVVAGHRSRCVGAAGSCGWGPG